MTVVNAPKNATPLLLVAAMLAMAGGLLVAYLLNQPGYVAGGFCATFGLIMAYSLVTGGVRNRPNPIWRAELPITYWCMTAFYAVLAMAFGDLLLYSLR